MKHCSKCQLKKAGDQFREYKAGKYRSECRNCENEQGRKKHAAHKVAGTKPPNCACCSKETEDLVVDHCHDTGMFRGWICRNCNSGIGKLGDDLEGVIQAFIYLSNSEYEGIGKRMTIKIELEDITEPCGGFWNEEVQL